MKVPVLTTEPISAAQLRDALGDGADLTDAELMVVARQDGVSAAANTGEGDVLEAVSDALQTFAADRIVLFAHPPGDKALRRGHRRIPTARAFGLPVDRTEVAARD